MFASSDDLIQALILLSQHAGEKLRALYQKAALNITAKVDKSPVTEADMQSHHILIEGLSRIDASVPIISEEGDLDVVSSLPQQDTYWVIDPLDGTKEYIAGIPEFCICIALVETHRPQLGLIYLPMQDTWYFATREGSAYKQVGERGTWQRLHTRKIRPGKPIKMALSRFHASKKAKAMLQSLDGGEVVRMGSAIKYTQIAEGLADLYPSFGSTKVWDSAAGQCIVEAAGGKVLRHTGQDLSYNLPKQLANPGFLAVGDANYPWRELLALLA